MNCAKWTRGALAFVMLWSAGAVCLAMEHGNAAGHIRVVDGDVWIMRGEKRVDVKVGGSFYPGDILRTGKNGKTGITFRDNTRFSMGPGSELVLEDFVFQPREKQYSLAVSMMKGTFSFLSGLIGKLSPESAEIKTPVGTIGIRGTHFCAKIEGE